MTTASKHDATRPRERLHVNPTEPGDHRGSGAPKLMPGTVVVPRGRDGLQIGLAPDRAVEVSGGPGLPVGTLARILSALDGRTALERIVARHGLGGEGLTAVEGVLRRLAAVGHVSLRASTFPDPDREVPDADRDDLDPAARIRSASAPLPGPLHRILVIGGGQLAQAVREPLNATGCRVRTVREPGLELDAGRPPWRTGVERDDLVIVADHLVPDPVLTEALARSGQTHLHLYARDGRVVVGPTVVPGHTSCLRCMQWFRADQDPGWPEVAAGLLGVTTTAPTPALTAGVALVVSEILASRGGPGVAQTLGATVEISPGEGLWSRRVWPSDHRCRCG